MNTAKSNSTSQDNMHSGNIILLSYSELVTGENCIRLQLRRVICDIVEDLGTFDTRTIFCRRISQVLNFCHLFDEHVTISLLLERYVNIIL